MSQRKSFNNRVVVIAEAGVNHNGDLGLAKELVDVAVGCGADFIKFQTFNSHELISEGVKLAQYQSKNLRKNISQLEMLRNLELTRTMHEELYAYCQQRRIKFLSTAFDISSLDYLMSLDLELIKVPSGEITNVPYLRHAAAFGKPILLSSGMSTLDEVRAAVEIIESRGLSRDLITCLHCTTDYPAPMRDINLYAMCAIRSDLKVEVGYSDHSLGSEVSIAAVALGAAVIEKHITLDSKLPGPDHAASMEPESFKAFVHAIRNIEDALGDGIKRPSLNESNNKKLIRKSIVARGCISKGESFSVNNLTTKRVGSGVCASRWDEILAGSARRDYCDGEAIDP